MNTFLKKKSLIAVVLIVMLLVVSGCSKSNGEDNDKINIVTTTTILADLAGVIGGEHVQVRALMGPGIDPHLYKASAGDVNLLHQADLIVHNGLHLEGKMGDVFENLEGAKKRIVKISEGVDSTLLISDETTNAPDPHLWFNVLLWKELSNNLLDGLIDLDPKHTVDYINNHEAYGIQLDALDAYIKAEIEKVPDTSRILITAHDAFKYFGEAYGFEVLGLQGISTTAEAGTSDVTNLANVIVTKRIKAIFVESSVPRKNIEALQEAVAAQGFDVAIGGELYSDSLGSSGSDAETYIGTVKSNIDTIVRSLQ